MHISTCNSYLDCLASQRFVRVWYILHSYAIELAFVNVRHPVVFTPLVGGDRRFQEIAETAVGESVDQTRANITIVNELYTQIIINPLINNS